jgi:hypothetical protein
MTSLTIALLAILMTAPVVTAQDVNSATEQPDVLDVSPPVFEADTLILRYYTPQVADSHSVANVMERFYRREFYVKAKDGSTSGPVRNIQAFGDSVMIYDTPEFVDRMMAAMESLELATSSERERAEERAANETLTVAQYSPRYQPVKNLYRALEPFRQEVIVGSDVISGRARHHTAWNVTALDEPATLVLRDTAASVDQMLGLLRDMDVPAPQVLVTVWLLSGSHEQDQGHLPRQLVENLSRLVPYASFTRESMGVLRSSVIAGQAMTIRGDVGPQDSFELRLIPGGYDVENQQLAITSCEFSTGVQAFTTSTVVRAGEYTVLGATGSDPVFVVLQVSPLDD